jgi:hypothetical protein
MASNKRIHENTPAAAEAFYEELASQEEIYLEEGVENLRKTKSAISEAKSESRIVDGLDEQPDHAVEEFITGDSDDPPLSEAEIAKMLSMGLSAQRHTSK